ncbi:MAG TPA: hypothetical protein VNA28_13420 [Solirubrobacteraceae bacterium]|nr:hypothetical protein [Solirubrobacteraceae bacterium]
MADKKDPTITSAKGDSTIKPAPAIGDADHNVGALSYEDNPDKPDPTTVAQIQVVPDGWPGQ